MCLAQGSQHSAPVRLEPATSRSRVKHSTTEPLRSLKHMFKLMDKKIITNLGSKSLHNWPLCSNLLIFRLTCIKLHYNDHLDCPACIRLKQLTIGEFDLLLTGESLIEDSGD